MAQTVWRYLDATAPSYDTPPVSSLQDAESIAGLYTSMFFNKTMEMFIWEGLPATIPAAVLERMLQTYGYVAFCKTPVTSRPYGLDLPVVGSGDLPDPAVESGEGGASAESSSSANDLYIFIGGLAGPPSPYYTPTRFIVANPSPQFKGTGFHKEYEIGTDCYIMKNDTAMRGLLPIHSFYATQLAENAVSLHVAQINSRAMFDIIADTDTGYESAVGYLNALANGELAAIQDRALTGNTRVDYNSATSAQLITNLIEAGQSQKVAWSNDIGLDPVMTLKREYISANELDKGQAPLLPLVDNMLQCRQWACEQINALFGTSISVRKSSAWDVKANQIERGNGDNADDISSGDEESASTAND